ncbi:hypothetical protein ACLK19_18575 [Escherichia coli]
MTNYSLRARMMILIGTDRPYWFIAEYLFVHRYNHLQRQLEDAGASIIEPLAVSTEYGISLQNRESIGQLVWRTASSPFRYCLRAISVMMKITDFCHLQFSS